MNRSAIAPALTGSCLVLCLTSSAVLAVTIPTVPVGNPGNAGEVQSQGTFGAVGYRYRIGTTEVTNAQYAQFLKAKAASDPFGLYNTGMGGAFGGITRSGSSGSYTYSTIAGRENVAVNFVSWYDSIRFANWLHNGQGAGDTETGAYTLLGGTPTPSNGLSITRNAGALWFLPSEDEWYKAAYHKNDGATGNYFDYPTASDTAPTAEVPAGGGNSANYDFAVGDFTDGGAYTDSASPYGTFDQAGNVWEWNEALVSGSFRGLRGGSFNNNTASLQSSSRPNINPTSGFGFRVATVPEPSTAVLAIVGMIGVATCYFTRKRSLNAKISDPTR